MQTAATATATASTSTEARYARTLPTIYVQRRGDGYLETVDEFEGWREARKMLAEYQMADPSAHHYLSRRACKGWRT